MDFESCRLHLSRGHDGVRQLRGAEWQYTAFAERRRVEARGYVDDLRATAKLLAGERHLPKPRAASGREMRDALLPTFSPSREISAEAVRSPHARRSRGR